MGTRYFCRDEFNGDFETFETIEEAFKFSKEAIGDGSDGWPEEILDGAVQVGIILYESAEANRRENDKDEDGEVINNLFDYVCDVVMAEVECDLIENLKNEIKQLNFEKCKLIKAISNIREARSNGEHVDASWVKDEIELQASSERLLKSAHLIEVENLKRQIKELTPRGV